MNLADLCLKLYLWPLLANIAKHKGICNNNYKATPFPYITLPPGATFPTTTSSTSGSGSGTSASGPTTLPTFPTLPPRFAPFQTLLTGPAALQNFPTLPTRRRNVRKNNRNRNRNRKN